MQGLWDLDQELFRAIHLGWHRDWLDPVFWVISTSGLGWVQLCLVGLSFLAARPTPWQVHAQRFAAPCVLAWATSGLLNTVILKNLIPRDRPSLQEIASPQETFFRGSFPSGHTAASFAMATVLWFLARDAGKPKWGYLALLWAALVGISRVYRGVHWPTDVIGGACVGVFCGLAVRLITAPNAPVDLSAAAHEE